jgi:hypothetical protein
MRNTCRILFATGCLLVLAGIWPVLPLVNRIYPFVLGLPFFVFYMLMLNLAVAIFLFIAFRTTK